MTVTLQTAKESDAAAIFDMQLKAFTPLLEKYQDHETNPANETIEKVIRRITHPDGQFFIILMDGHPAGAINIVRKTGGSLWISPIFIVPEFQGRGLAQQAIRLAESRFPQAETWELSTLAEEKGNCFLYEKLGYTRTSASQKLNDRTTLVYYRKEGLDD